MLSHAHILRMHKPAYIVVKKRVGIIANWKAIETSVFHYVCNFIADMSVEHLISV